MNKNMLLAVIAAMLVTACQFDESGVAIPGDDDLADEFVCETDVACQEVGFHCNIYSCTDESRCVVADSLCEDGEVCTKNGCTEAPAVVMCENHGDCTEANGYTLEEGCAAAYCAEAGTCESYSCGSSLCESNDDCAADEHCSDAGACVDDETSSTGDLEIHCDNVDGVRVTFSGDIKDGIVTSDGNLPGTPGKVSIAGNYGFGSGVYWPSTSSGIDSTHPTCDVAVDGDGKWSCASTLGFGDSVQEFQFVVANSANTALRYFDLSKWSVTGYCAKDATGGLLCSCESLPCSCN